MTGGQIILNTISPEEMAEIIKPLIVEAIREVLQEKEEKLLSPAEVCKKFVPAISKTTLAAWTKQGILTDYRIGGRVYYKMTEVVKSVKNLKKYKGHVNLINTDF
jgi:hypothetical protein